MPLDGPNGSAVYAEASVTGRKKDAVRECANEACKILDAYGLLRQSTHGTYTQYLTEIQPHSGHKNTWVEQKNAKREVAW